MRADARRIAVFGAWDGGLGGNQMSTRILARGLVALGYDVVGVGPARSSQPGRTVVDATECLLVDAWRWGTYGESWHVRAGVRRFLAERGVVAAWAVNSRYGVTVPRDVPLAIWEDTTRNDELVAVRRGQVETGVRPGPGQRLHALTYPIDRVFERRVLGRAERVCAMSEHTARCLAEEGLVDASRVEVVWHPPEPAFETVVGEGGDAERARDFIFVGRGHDPRKGLHMLVGALAGLEAKNVSVTLVGAGNEQAAARIRAAGVDARCAVAATTDALIGELRAHRAFVLPSLQEGFAIVAAEALHLGLPVVSTRCGGPEGYLAASGAGILCDRSPEALGRAIGSFLALGVEREEAMRRAATSFARRRLSTSAFCENIGRVTAALGAEAVAPASNLSEARP